MVFKASATLTLLALFTAVKTSPAPTTKTADVNAAFTFRQWIEGIIADPDGTHLSPEQAVATSQLTRRSDDHMRRQSYVTCMDEISEHDFLPANAIEAAHCVEMLARKGAMGVMCDVPARVNYSGSSIYCQTSSSEIVGTSGGGWGFQTSSCADAARAPGWIFDQCWKKETRTVRGIADNPGNRELNVEVRGVRRPG